MLITGTEGDDLLIGTLRRDVISGLGGADQLLGLDAPRSVRRHRLPLRNLIERAFCRLKDWRRIVTRFDSSPSTTPPRSHRNRPHLVDLIESRP